jgi:hypothetical protein
MTRKMIEKRVHEASENAKKSNEPTLIEKIMANRNLPLLLKDTQHAE